MKTPKFTRGPWTFNMDDTDIDRPDLVRIVGSEKAEYIEGNLGVALTDSDNAHLIAAAPCMLEALETMYEMYKVLLNKNNGRDDSILFNARQVIKKARGEG